MPVEASRMRCESLGCRVTKVLMGVVGFKDVSSGMIKIDILRVLL